MEKEDSEEKERDKNDEWRNITDTKIDNGRVEVNGEREKDKKKDGGRGKEKRRKRRKEEKVEKREKKER